MAPSTRPPLPILPGSGHASGAPSRDARPRRAIARLLGPAALLAALAACESTVGPRFPEAVEAAAGDGQSAAVGSALPTPLRVRVVDGRGRGVSGVEVRWETTSGSVAPATARTDGSGYAEGAWTLGTRAGAQRAVASAADAGSRAFDATALAGPAVSLRAFPEEVSIRRRTTVRLSAQGADAHGNPVPVTWTPLDTSVVRVDAAGTATAGRAGSTRVVVRSGALTDTSRVQVEVSWTSLAPASAFTCGVSDESAVYCWGVIGIPNSGVQGIAIPVPARFDTLRLASVTAGTGHACGLTAAGEAFCWGSGSLGALGDGTDDHRRIAATPVRVSGGLRFASMEATGAHTCGLTPDGRAFCWGGTFYTPAGQYEPYPVPTAFAPELRFTSLATGFNHTCGLTPGGDAFCWGVGTEGQLGDGRSVSSAEPVRVGGSVRFASLYAGGNVTCGLTAAGEAHCWGYNGYGQVGDGTQTTRPLPTAVAGGVRFASLSVGDLAVCGRTADGAAYCWGHNGSGTVGNGSTAFTPAPAQVVGGLRFTSVRTEWSHTCGVTQGGEAYCWGADGYGQLGDARSRPQYAPVRVVEPR